MDKEEFKLIIAGGRDFNDYSALVEKFDELSEKLKNKNISVVSGMARGADALGYRLSTERGLQVYEFYADWDNHGKSAGVKRNILMGDFSDGLLCFWDGKSKGTKHMREYMIRLNKPVRTVIYGLKGEAG